ncbi:MAG: type IV pilus secretin PilQ [Neisseriaceae bacterium]|nr:MAG: type IV pilus secretin PilQ [Neisseriaceae bacterium]
MLRLSKRVISVLVLLLIQFSWAGNISKLELAVIDNSRVIKIKFNGDVVMPKAISKQNNFQVTLDFHGVKSLVDRHILEYDDPILSSIVLSELRDTTQITIQMKQQSIYKLVRRGDEIWLYVDPSSQKIYNHQKNDQEVNNKSSAKATTYGIPRGNQNPIKLEFRRMNNGSGTIALIVNHQHETPQVKKFNNRLQIKLKNYRPVSEAQNIYDVTEFNTIVRSIDINKQGNDAIVTVYTNGGNWDYRLSDHGSEIVVDVYTNESIFSTERVGKSPNLKYKGGKVSFDFQNIEVRTILQILAKEGNINIVASDSVKGKLTLKLNNVRWDEALDLILQSRNLGMRKVGSIIHIAPKSEFEVQDRQQLMMEKDQISLGGLQSRSFQVKYKSVEDLKKMVEKSSSSSSGNSILSKRGSIMIDEGTNTVIVTDIPASIDKFERMLQQIDISRDQVMISARIVEVKDTYARNLGMKLGAIVNRNNGDNQYRGSIGGGSLSSSTALSPNINLPVVPGVSGSTGFSLIRSTNSAIVNLEISAMQEEGNAKIISSPRVLTLNGEQALLEEGVEVPYRTMQGGNDGFTMKFKRAVTSLKVTPQIIPDGNVILDVEVSKDTPFQDNGAIGVKKLNTRAMIEDGGTLILGGIYDESSSDGINKVPLLGDIPLLGNIFKTQNRNSERREVLIFLTPKVVKSSEDSLFY